MDLNVTIVITNVSVEFTSLGSFGNADAFAAKMVGGWAGGWASGWVRRQSATGP